MWFFNVIYPKEGFGFSGIGIQFHSNPVFVEYGIEINWNSQIPLTDGFLLSILKPMDFDSQHFIPPYRYSNTLLTLKFHKSIVNTCFPIEADILIWKQKQAYNMNTLDEIQRITVKDLADLGLIKLQQVNATTFFFPYFVRVKRKKWQCTFMSFFVIFGSYFHFFLLQLQ